MDISGEYTVSDHEVMDDGADSIEFTVKKAYVAYQTDRFSVLLGKDRFLKGVGFGWNPSDITNPQKSPLYQDESKMGDEEGVRDGILFLFWRYRPLLL